MFPFVIGFEFFTDINSTNIRVICLFDYKLGNNGTKVGRNISQAFGENTVNDLKVQSWYEKFRFGEIPYEINLCEKWCTESIGGNESNCFYKGAS